MLYTLARYRFHRPSPPFQLGGEFLSAEGRHFLRDAVGAIEMIGLENSDLDEGDLIRVWVESVDAEGRLRASDVRLEHKPEGAWSVRPRPQAARYTVFVARVRQFFVENGLTELFTPSLVPCPGLEPSLEPFATVATKGSREQKLYLPTSPEIHLKKAMAAGWLDIFEIKPCFRRGEFSAHHENEFTMLEWYRGFADLTMIEADLRRLVGVLVAEGWLQGPAEIVVTDFAALFRSHLGFELRPSTTVDELRGLCLRLGVETGAEDTFSDLFHRLLIDRLEPVIAAMGPVIIKRFPPSQAALARLDMDGWADRFEFYWNGLEIANAFNEVNDPLEQRRRWDFDVAERARLGTTAVPQDPGLIAALARGLPPSGGIALGVERLFMAGTGVADIRELRLFSVADFF